MVEPYDCGEWAVGYPWAPASYYPQYWPGPYGGFYPFPCYPGYWQTDSPPSAEKLRMLAPEERVLDSGSPGIKTFIGGIGDVNLVLEYMRADEATEGSITVTITGSGSTSEWKDPSISNEFQVKQDFPPSKPGARIEVQAVNAIARLRWCEVVQI